MKIRRLSVVGLGLIGSSIAMAARRCVKPIKITGYDRSTKVQAVAVRRRIIDSADLSAARECDLLIVATPVEAIPSVFREIASTLPPGAVITDTCSTKRSAVAAGGRFLPRGRYVGSHPMFGSERSGIEHADADLLSGNRVILTPTRQTHPSTVQAVTAFWRAVGLTPATLSPTEHDRRMARLSHLPQAVASLLMSLQNASWLSLAGRGLRDTTRLAGSDPKLWAGILIDNADHAAAEIRRMARSLQELADAIESRDSRAVARIINAGRTKRRALCQITTASRSRT